MTQINQRPQPYDPDDRPPPRPVNAWTNVIGHDLIAADQAGAYCACGARPKLGDAANTDDAALHREVGAWWDRHRAEAWPILLPRRQNEQVRDHYTRLREEALKADAASLEAEMKSMPKGGIQAGQAYPRATEGETTLRDRADCIRHQLDHLTSRHPGLLRSAVDL